MCKILTAVVYYSIIANTAWMFVEALFLHARLTVSVFEKSDSFYVYYFIGWGNVTISHRAVQKSLKMAIPPPPYI